MADYIRRDIVLEIINTVNDTGGFAGYADYCVLFDEIDTMPAADVQPVKHGYWIKQPEKFQIHEDVINSNYLYSCSCCNASDLHSERANNDGEVKFCWRCGARMDGDNNA